MGNKRMEIAVVGMACRFPGADGYDSFWENLIQERNSISEVPLERWDAEKFYSLHMNDGGRASSKWCGVVEGAYEFDNNFFNISPREAASMDPQQRLLLEDTWHCIEDSGIPLSELQRKVTSVYTGVMAVDYLQQMQASHADSYACLGNYESLLANRISYTFNLRGMSMPINAACASSLVAIHEARRSLMLGESDYALAAAVNLNLDPLKYVSFSQSRMLSPTGQCKTFDQSADGYVPGDGIGVVLLQRLDEAIEQGNHIYGIIKGSAVNHTGKSLSITAPRMEAQRDVILDAWKTGDIDPRTITYIEAHGTGTSLGDPIEVEALTQAFRQHTTDLSFCKIGSVKTNIGHLESAAGIAGLIKVMMMMKHRMIPASLHVKKLNPMIPFSSTPLEVAQTQDTWHSSEEGGPLRAGISSFGFGGVNAHVVVEHYEPASNPSPPSPEDITQSSEHKFQLFLLSAKSEASLQEHVADWQQWSSELSNKEETLRDISLTLLKGREHFKYRFGGWVNTKNALQTLLKSGSYGNRKTGASAMYLNIQQPLWEGYAHLDCSGHMSEFILQTLEKQMELALEASRSSLNEQTKDLMSGFYQSTWPKARWELYRFMAGYVYAHALIQLGFKPQWIEGTGTGTLIAWVVGGIVSVQDMISLLLKEKHVGGITLNYPVWPVHEEQSSFTIMPFTFDESYVKELIESLRLLETKVYDHVRNDLIDRAHRLYTHQHTFRNYINEWSEDWYASTGTNINWQLQSIPDSRASELSRTSSVLLCIAVMDALRKVRRKWQLQVTEKAEIPAIQELLDLLSDQVITRKQIIHMLEITEENLYISEITTQLNQRANLLQPDRPYALIGKHQLQTDAMHNVAQILNGFIHSSMEEGKGTALYHVQNSFGWRELNRHKEVKEVTLTLPFHENILNLWLSGLELDMQQLADGEPYQKVRLPRYAFQRKKFHWSSDSGQPAKRYSKESVRIATFKQRIHPMLHRNLSVNEDINFKSNFTGNEFFLNDHRVKGKRVLPAVAYLEMARVAMHCVNQLPSSSLTTFQLKNVAWTSPIYADENPVHVTIRLKYEDREQGRPLRYEICEEKRNSDQLSLLNCGTGSLTFKSFEQVNRLDVPSIIDAMIDKHCLDRGMIYDHLKEQGLEYGSGHQPIELLYVGSNEILAKLILPSSVECTFKDYVLHPSMMDGALQAAMFLLDPHSTLPDQERATKLPFYIEELDCILPCAEEMWVHVRLGKEHQTGGKLEKLDIDLTNAEGAVCVQIRNYMCRNMQVATQPQHALQNEGQADVSMLKNWNDAFQSGTQLLTPMWSVLPMAKDSINLSRMHRTAIFTPQSRALSSQINELKKDYPDAAIIRMNSDDTIDQLLPKLKSLEQFDHLMWVSDKGNADGKDAHTTIQSQREGVILLFNLVKSLLELGYDRIALRWTVLTFNAVAVHAQEHIHPLHASIHGFIGSLSKEYKNWAFQVIDLDSDASMPSLNDTPVLSETSWNNLTVYRAQQWHCCELMPVKLPSMKESAYRRGGIYVVIGGAGGLGKVWSEYMIRHYNAKMIWIGRTPLNADIAGEQARLAKMGPPPEYISVDAGSPEALRETIRLIKQRHETIHGVIHAAIVLRDSSVMKMSLRQLNEGLYAKVNVCAAMFDAFKEETLDFMLFFSSINAFTSPPGQSNYAAGCAFKDSFAHWMNLLLPYPVKTMNWGYWGGAGSVASPAYRERMAKQGIGSIEPDEGMAALEMLLASSLAQLSLVKVIGDARPYAMNENEFVTVYPYTCNE